MTWLRTIQCDGPCASRLDFEGHPTQEVMLKSARRRRWTLTADGRHFCCSCQENRKRKATR